MARYNMTTRLTMFQLGVGNSTQVNGIEAFDVINTRPPTEVPLFEIRRARIAPQESVVDKNQEGNQENREKAPSPR